MLKKRVLKRLLPLLFSFCCVFSGFLSVNAFASDIVGLSNGNVIRYSTGKPICIIVNSNGSAVYNGQGSFNEYAIGSTPLSNYSFDSPSVNASSIWFGHEEFNNNVVVNTELFDYYFIFVVTANNSNFTFVPSSFRVQSYANGTPIVSLTDFSYTSYSDGNAKGFCCIGKMPDVDFSQFAYFNVNGSGVLSEDIYISPFVYVTEKGSETSVDSIISAINNQTGALQGSIGQAADDVQQSIEDQYSGDPETEFSVDDVITQHNEKMGVLSFGSDVMLQFLDMFQSANVGTAELTLPGFNITVENVEYSVWPDYSFNFEQLNEWVPALMSVIRVMLPAFVWLMVLRYCIKVFEDNFLAK